MAVAAARITQRGTVVVEMTPAEKSANVMIPIVFWASFDP
jgi:hypothetical protein